MRLLILANNDGGLYQFRKELLEKLIEEHEVFCSVPDEEGFVCEIERLGCKWLPISFNRRSKNIFQDVSLLRNYKKIIGQINPDVILTYTIKPNIYGGIAAQIKKKAYIVNITGLGTALENGGIFAYLLKYMYRAGLRKANCVFFQNRDNQNRFKEEKIVSGKTRIIPGSGVNLYDHCLEEYPDDNNGIRFLFIGRIMKDKGIEELLKAIEILHKKNSLVSLDIVGNCDESYESVLEDICKNGYIRWHGLQKNVHQFIKKSHCTVLPSYHEGTANVVLESASTGRPVITTFVPGCRETFDEGVTGFGCEARSVESLIQAMEKFIMLNFDEKKQMGINARKKMESEYDRSIVVKAYIDEINSINQKRRK